MSGRLQGRKIKRSEVGKDHSQLRMGQAPQFNATLNNTVIGLLSLVGKKNVAAARRSMEYDPWLAFDYAIALYIFTGSFKSHQQPPDLSVNMWVLCFSTFFTNSQSKDF